MNTSTLSVASGSSGKPSARAGLSLQDQAFEAIKFRIITCVYAPGQYLNEKRISGDIGIGRTPIHQSLARLASLGLVEVIPRKGIIVTPVSLHDVVNIADARVVNETRCAALAAERGATHHFDQLDSILEQSVEAKAGRDIERLMLLDRDFHGVLADAARNSVLADIMRMLHERSLRMWFISLNDQVQLERVYAEHCRIAEAVKTRDPAAAAEAMRQHISSYVNNIKVNI